MLELYHYWESVCSSKVRICLAEKQVDWTGHIIDIMAFEHTRPDYVKLNPLAVVPTLIHDGTPIIESSFINEYLDDVFPDPPLRPADPIERARMRAWVKYQDDVVHPTIRIPSFAILMKDILAAHTDEELAEMAAHHPDELRANRYLQTAREENDEDEMAFAQRQLQKMLDRFDAQLSRTAWLASDDYSLADIAMAPMMDRLEYLAMAGLWEGRPAVRDWITRLKARPGYQRGIPPMEHRFKGPLTAPA